MVVLQLVVLLLAEVTLGSPQLIGHRGVITLREGQVGPQYSAGIGHVTTILPSDWSRSTETRRPWLPARRPPASPWCGSRRRGCCTAPPGSAPSE